MTTRRQCLTALAAPLSGQRLFGQSKEARAKQIVERAIEALGGAAFRAMRDRVEFGRAYSFYNDRIRGLSRATIRTRYLTAPDSPAPDALYVRERQSFGKKDEEDYAVLFQEDKAWNITFRGAAPLPDDLWARYQDTTRRNAFYMLKQRLREPGLVFESRGTAMFDNYPVDVVDFTDAANNVTTVQFLQSDGLPARQVFYRRDPSKVRHEEETVFSKYREVGGVKWPYAITRRRDGEKIFEMFSETVTVNQDIPDQRFLLPAGMKVLPPPR